MTDDVQTAPPPAPVEPEAPLGFFQRLGGVLFSPDETFADIVRRPNVLAPLALFVVISILSVVLIMPRMDFATMMRDQIERSPRAANMSAADMDRAVRMSSAFAKMVSYVSPVLAVAFWAIVAAVLVGTFRLLGGEGTYKQAFSVTLYAWLPLFVQSIIATIVALTKSTINPEEMGTLVASSPAVFVDMHEHRIAFSFLSSIDLFVIWTVVLLIIGFAHVSRMSKARSAAIVLSWWGVMLFFKVGFAAFGAMRMKAGS